MLLSVDKTAGSAELRPDTCCSHLLLPLAAAAAPSTHLHIIAAALLPLLASEDIPGLCLYGWEPCNTGGTPEDIYARLGLWAM